VAPLNPINSALAISFLNGFCPVVINFCSFFIVRMQRVARLAWFRQLTSGAASGKKIYC
jgi:hypothetical protein